MAFMAICEMCGKETETVLAEVEGVELKLCHNCTKYGRVKSNFNSRSSRSDPRHYPSFKKEQPEERIISSFGSLIRQNREKKGLTQQDFAKLLNERESVLVKWESGALFPDLEMAKRLEKQLGIVLIVKEEGGTIAQPIQKEKERSDVLTLGDFIKVRKRN